MPLQRRLPKGGFTNIFRVEYSIVNVKQLDARFEDGAVVDPQGLVDAGLARNTRRPVKVLGNGEIGKNVTVKVHKISATAQSKVEAAGGTVEVIGG